MGAGLRRVERRLRLDLGDLRLHLGLRDGDGGVPLRFDLLQLGLLLVDQAFLPVLLGQLHRHLLVPEGLLVVVRVAEVPQHEMLHLEAPLCEALPNEALGLLDRSHPHALVVERLRIHLPEGGQHPVAEGVDHERVDVEGAPAEVLGHFHRVLDGVEEGHVGDHRVSVRGLDVQGFDRPVGGFTQEPVAAIEVLVDLLGNAGAEVLRLDHRVVPFVGGVQHMDLPREDVHGDAGADEIEPGSVGVGHDAGLEAELPLLDPELVGEDAGRARRVEDEHEKEGRDPQEQGPADRPLQDLERPAHTGHLHHQRSPSLSFLRAAFSTSLPAWSAASASPARRSASLSRFGGSGSSSSWARASPRREALSVT